MSGKKKKKADTRSQQEEPTEEILPESVSDDTAGEVPAEETAEITTAEIVPDEVDPKAALELAAQRDRMARLQADFENYKRRVIRDKSETYRRANEDIMEELLPVLDHLDLAFATAGEDDLANPVVQGLKLVADQLRSALGKFGLEAFDATGELFNPNEHEAVSHLPSADVTENHVMVQTRGGYRLGSYLLRPAQVVVSSGAPGAAADGEA